MNPEINDKLRELVNGIVIVTRGQGEHAYQDVDLNGIDDGILDSIVEMTNKREVSREMLRSMLSNKFHGVVVEKIRKSVKSERKITQDDKDTIIKSSFEELSSLPITYEFIFHLPTCTASIDTLDITSTIHIQSVNNVIFNKLQPEVIEIENPSLIERMFAARRLQIFKESDLILKIDASGWVDNSAFIINVRRKPDNDPFFIFKTIISYFLVQNALIENKPPNCR